MACKTSMPVAWPIADPAQSITGTRGSSSRPDVEIPPAQVTPIKLRAASQALRPSRPNPPSALRKRRTALTCSASAYDRRGEEDGGNVGRDMTPPEKNLVPETAGGAFAVLMGFAAAGTGGGTGSVAELGVAVAGAVLTPPMSGLARAVAKEWASNGAEVAHAAAAAAGLTHDKLMDTLADEDELHPLLRQVLEAAERTGDIRKLRTLGTVLGEAVTSRPRRVDEAAIIVAALRDLEPAHVRVLELLQQPGPDETPNTEATQAWLPQSVAQNLPEVMPSLVAACLNALTRHGLATTRATWNGGSRYELTEFGQVMIDVLRRAAPA